MQIRNKLYHGTTASFEEIELSKGRGRKDFGKGFYLSTDKRQAIGMMHKKHKEEVKRKNIPANAPKYLYEIHVNKEAFEYLNVKIFKTADIEWLDFILICRNSNGTPHSYDVVIGPTADDDTSFCLKMYMDGVYGKEGSKEAKRILLMNLEAQKLGTQYFIATERGKNIIGKKYLIDWSV